MMVSSKGRYALRVMIYLAQNDREELIPLKEIAENQNISMKYLEMIVSLLHKGNMLISGRGKKGGYRLARKPSEYTIGSILKLTEKTLAPVNCLEGGKVTCEKAGYCITLPMWQKLDGIIDDYLETVTLEDLLVLQYFYEVVFYVKIMMAYGYKSNIRETESILRSIFSEIMYMIKNKNSGIFLIKSY